MRVRSYSDTHELAYILGVAPLTIEHFLHEYLEPMARRACCAPTLLLEAPSARLACLPPPSLPLSLPAMPCSGLCSTFRNTGPNATLDGGAAVRSTDCQAHIPPFTSLMQPLVALQPGPAPPSLPQRPPMVPDRPPAHPPLLPVPLPPSLPPSLPPPEPPLPLPPPGLPALPSWMAKLPPQRHDAGTAVLIVALIALVLLPLGTAGIATWHNRTTAATSHSAAAALVHIDAIRQARKEVAHASGRARLADCALGSSSAAVVSLGPLRKKAAPRAGTPGAKSSTKSPELE